MGLLWLLCLYGELLFGLGLVFWCFGWVLFVLGLLWRCCRYWFSVWCVYLTCVYGLLILLFWCYLAGMPLLVGALWWFTVCDSALLVY